MAASRRQFLAAIAGFAGIAAIPGRASARIPHPDPRPDIDASLVLTPDDIDNFSDEVKEIYAMIREIPHIADGLGCACGCAAFPTYRSLLTCYYSTGMAMGCPICQGEAKLAYRRHKRGQSLAQIRRAIDARYS